MANTNYGVLGNFMGTIGPVTGYVRNGKNILRTSTSSVKDKHTPLQLQQREKIKLCSSFTKPFNGTGFFNKTFPAYGHTGTGHNRATSALLSLAIMGTYPNMQLDYKSVLISKGKLPGAINAKLVLKQKSVLQFTFTNNAGTGIATANDAIILVAYCPDLKQAIFTVSGGLRKDGKASLNVVAFKGHSVETWIGFLSSDEKDAGDSVWTGNMKVLEHPGHI